MSPSGRQGVTVVWSPKPQPFGPPTTPSQGVTEMDSVFSRYADILAENGLRPFHTYPWVNPRTEEVELGVIGGRPRARWRVSRDEWDKLLEFARRQHGWSSIDQETYLGGWPIAPDDSVPPGTILFEWTE